MAARVERLAWRDVPIGEIDLPKKKLRITLGLGSGLTRRAGDSEGRVFAVTDRGPNMFASTAVDDYGLTVVEHLRGAETKLMPTPGLGPEIVELQVEAGSIHLVRRLPLRTQAGRRLSGLPLPASNLVNEEAERILALDGRAIALDGEASFLGADAEAIAAMPGGGFFVAEEYGPSLLKVDANGIVLERWVSAGHEITFGHHDLPARGVLPGALGMRRINRGLEALCASPDGAWLYTGLQSAPSSSDARAVPIWKLDACDGAVAAEWLYPFDAPETFRRDAARRKLRVDDLKICEFVWVGENRLVVLERISHSAKLYLIDMARLPEKTLLLSTDDHPQIGPDIEGVTMLSPNELLIASDNDFGVEGAETEFWRIVLDHPLPF